jgi:hypothetical protein
MITLENLEAGNYRAGEDAMMLAEKGLAPRSPRVTEPPPIHELRKSSRPPTATRLVSGERGSEDRDDTAHHPQIGDHPKQQLPRTLVHLPFHLAF